MGAVGDRRAKLRAPVRGARVEPIESLAFRHPAPQIVEVASAARLGRIGMPGTVAPVGDRRVEIDADGVDRRMGPQGVEREAELGAPNSACAPYSVQSAAYTIFVAGPTTARTSAASAQSSPAAG